MILFFILYISSYSLMKNQLRTKVLGLAIGKELGIWNSRRTQSKGNCQDTKAIVISLVPFQP